MMVVDESETVTVSESSYLDKLNRILWINMIAYYVNVV